MSVFSKSSLLTTMTTLMIVPAISIAAPTWKKVTIGGSSGGGSGSAPTYSCVSMILGQKLVPASAVSALNGITVSYTVVGGGGGAGVGSGVFTAGTSGELKSGTFIVDGTKSYEFIVGGGGGGGGSGGSTFRGGGGGSTAILEGGVLKVGANGGDGATGTGATTTAVGGVGGYAGGGNGYFGGGGYAAGSGRNGSANYMNTSFGGQGGNFGGAGGVGYPGCSSGLSMSKAATGQNGNSTCNGVKSDLNGMGLLSWASSSSPIVPSLAGLGGMACSSTGNYECAGGNPGIIVLSYTASMCVL